MSISNKVLVHVGIDEAGRGPLAGPVAVGVVIFSKDKIRLLRGIKDSKKLSSIKREDWFEKANIWRSQGLLDYHVSLVSNKVIDKRGIVEAVNIGIKKSLTRVKANPQNTSVYLDGSLRAPGSFVSQRTIIKGDEKVKIISLASVLAKVTRDRHMVKLSKKFPQYYLDLHKGYGTELHRKAIRKHGPSPIHRRSFLK